MNNQPVFLRLMESRKPVVGQSQSHDEAQLLKLFDYSVTADAAANANTGKQGGVNSPWYRRINREISKSDRNGVFVMPAPECWA